MPIERKPAVDKLKSSFYGLHPHFLSWIWATLLVLQMILAFFFSDPKIQILRVAGWAIWALGSSFALLPILTLRAKGGVPEGKNYMETTALVRSGIYAVVRHPQGGTAGLLFNLALPLIGQQWLLVAMAAVSAALLYIDTFKSDKACIEKFGQEYVSYMEQVPRVNFLAGIMRLLMSPSPESSEG
jgi:protein-S-isoprenylcysteine O-methyltransferase Ste14